MVHSKFLKKIRQRWFTLSLSKGFTLIEVLVSIGMLMTLVITVAYMTVSNQNEILRHNAESYADLIASDQFSALVAYRNQVVFDFKDTTYWSKDIYNYANSGGSLYVKNSNGSFSLAQGIKTDSKTLDDQGGHTDLKYFMNFSKMNKSDNSGVDPNLIKVHLQVTYTDRGGVPRDKNYYTVLANYLGSK